MSADRRIFGLSPLTVAALFGVVQGGTVAAIVVLFFEASAVRTAGFAFAAVSGILVAVALTVAFRALD